uniref:alpha-mannosidase n=1 Tax=Ornithodoros turicata TaxID=34597 RepID=A0A2R5LBB2_9ACAR
MASMFKNRRSTLERAEKFISPLYFTDVNLFGRIYPEQRPFTSLNVFSTPDRISFSEATKHADYEPATVGQNFGPTWTTCWFKVVVDIPNKWCGKEVHLRWNSESEALIWTVNGQPLQGLSGDERSYFIMSPSASVSCLHHEFYIEMACNTLFGAGSPTMISPPDPNKQFTLKQADIAIFDREIDALVTDIQILVDISRELPKDCIRGYEAMYTANEMINHIDFDDRTTLKLAKEIADHFFAQKNGDSQHRISAVGNCHIDSAWLWPYEETKRKCARSFSSALLLMEKYPQYHFACSQAQQLYWIKEDYPQLFDRIKQYVRRGQFIPVGGTWVEMDGNLPSGESFVRQFLYGQMFFEREFGVRCKEFWLPDTFGYSAQLPQIMRSCGISRFMTQKLSWNLVNKFPHHNFHWEGIDGSSVLTHFAPSETYSANVSVAEAMKTVNNLEDKGRTTHSLLLFGHGDGGGGPTEAMLQRQLRLEDVDGVPKVELSTPDIFFGHLEKDSKKLNRWSGELYLELHNATYTTHALTKKLNRECEFVLHTVELLCSVAAALGTEKARLAAYPYDELASCWRDVLLNQFHDVLPGSCILQVKDDAELLYRRVLKGVGEIKENTMRQLFGVHKTNVDGACDVVFVNTLCWPRLEIVEVPWCREELSKRCWIEGVDDNVMQDVPGGTLVSVNMGSAGYHVLRGIASHKVPVSAEQKGPEKLVLRNKFLEAELNLLGEITSLKLHNCAKQFVTQPQSCNMFVLFEDIPLFWDAWDVMDYHLETRRSAVHELLEPATILESGPLRARVRVKFAISSKSTLTQTLVLDAAHPYIRVDCDVDWHEAHKFLKVEFHANIRSSRASYEIQFGHLERATHFNTSWDWAKYEVYAHKWMDLEESGFGLAIMNTCKYGHAVHGSTMRLSLLRAPKSPDAEADMGMHEFTYAIMPHKGRFQEAGVIQQAYELNCPLEMVICDAGSEDRIVAFQDSYAESASWFQVSCPSVILETVKKAEHREDCLVLRLYEAYGGEVLDAVLTVSLPVAKVVACNALEDEDSELVCSSGVVHLHFHPFQVVSLLVFLKAPQTH